MCHMIGIPLILLALVKLTQWPIIFPWIALGLPIYFFWSWRLGASMSAVLALMAVISINYLTYWSAAGIFFVGWIFQLVGHYSIGKNHPSLAHNLVHLFVGPAWIIQKLAKKGLGISLW